MYTLLNIASSVILLLSVATILNWPFTQTTSLASNLQSQLLNISSMGQKLRVVENIPVQSILIRVPQDISTLQEAIDLVDNGGVIELAGGTYPSPAGEGFKIIDIGKSFTIRAATGATVILDGGNANQVVTYLNSSPGKGGPVIFEGLTFANGRSAIDGRAAGVTLHRAEGTFTNCTFRNNVGTQVNAGGGGVVVGINSTATFYSSLWENNVSQAGAGINIGSDSFVSVYDSQFLNNRTNLPNHSVVAAGAGIYVGNSTLHVSGSYFEGNQSGYVGGAIYAIGNWTTPVSTPRSRVTIIDSTFRNNQAIADPSVSLAVPTEGGAVHSEDQTTTIISDSYFYDNSAQTGGAVNLFRAITHISGSTFQGNKATGTGTGDGFGGAINVLSNDGDDSIRPGQLSLTHSLIQGQTGQTVAQTAGGIAASGDALSANSLQNPANRAKITIENVILDDIDVQAVGSGGLGAAFLLSFVEVTIKDALIVRNDARGTFGSGGGIAVLNNSAASFTNVIVAHNSAETYGAGIYGQGSQLTISNCKIIENELSPGIAETVNQSYGAGIFTASESLYNFNMTGSLNNCLISDNTGMPIFDDDRTNGPINDMRYNQNQIYSATFGTDVYRNSIAGTFSVAGLNNLTVSRANGTSTPKSQIGNTALTTKPAVGVLMAVPSSFFEISNSSLQASKTYTYYLGYTWSGNVATLDGVPLTDKAGVVQVSDTGRVHTLVVDGVPFTTQVNILVLDKKVYLPSILR